MLNLKQFEEANATVGNTPGMGPVILPGSPGNQYDFHTQTPGSGDSPKLLPTSQEAVQFKVFDIEAFIKKLKKKTF